MDVYWVQVMLGVFWLCVVVECDVGFWLFVDGLLNVYGVQFVLVIDVVFYECCRCECKVLFDMVLGQIFIWLGVVCVLIDVGDCGCWWIIYEEQVVFFDVWFVLFVVVLDLELLFFDVEIYGDLQFLVYQCVLFVLYDWILDWLVVIVYVNEGMIICEFVLVKDFLDKVESQLFIEEQVCVVICFDNWVQVVVLVGLGKMFMMVVKVVYVIDCGFVVFEQIVMLVFNKDVVNELQECVQCFFVCLGMVDIVVEVCMFYVLGLVIIVKVIGCKLDIFVWVVDVVQGFYKFIELVDDFKDCFICFCIQWDMFWLVFGCDFLLLGEDMLVDGYDCEGKFYICMLQGEWVKSMEECVIVDWLFYNGVSYEYECLYEFDIVIDVYCQYWLDFYYFDVVLYYEYFVLDVNG